MNTAQKTSSRTFSRKAKAILAGGLVLGVGAAITLAVWTDEEFSTATFGAGHFDLLGSTTGLVGDFSNHAVGSPATLTFSLGFNALSPSDTVAAPFVLHLDAFTTNDALVSVASATGSGVAEPDLSYGIVLVASVAACTPAAIGTTVVPAGTALDSVGVPVPFALLQSLTPGIIPGANAFLCIQVTASPTLPQDTGAVGTWEFVATSIP